ncbi:hypothetical protein [Bergeyella zoohelcum]|uniref:Uncharacterized protein n=1 Tax=Bergeyella zoohelcum ATCC 43767 TaxID=883096 RepID=K1LHT3_9FLAO|nr:hypothetical protein [Bergeyella zoohelcum]EKB54206.1 hypothetical protein HMPREF9699_02018 [Bergeyella zoohelcum ATCC 43767]SUV49907.1 Uncharacterised protein [Bergeyella zoohelcum]
MKYIVLLFFLPIMIFGQEIKIESKYGAHNKELRDILSFEGIDKINVKFIGKQIKNKHFKIFVKHIWEGKITQVDTLIDTRELFKKSIIESDTLSFNAMAKKATENQVKVAFNFKQFGNSKMYDATKSFDYSFRLIGDKVKIQLGKAFPLFAYILPYEKDGWKLYCAVDSSGKEVEKWGEEFGIAHYIIYEMIFEE